MTRAHGPITIVLGGMPMNRSQPTVLVADDNAIVRVELGAALEEAGYRWLDAGTANGALQIAAEKHPDLAIVDVHLLGDMDGIDAAVHLRERYGTRIIFVTGDASPATRERAERVRAADYVIKPYAMESLLQRIRAALAM